MGRISIYLYIGIVYLLILLPCWLLNLFLVPFLPATYWRTPIQFLRHGLQAGMYWDEVTRGGVVRLFGESRLGKSIDELGHRLTRQHQKREKYNPILFAVLVSTYNKAINKMKSILAMLALLVLALNTQAQQVQKKIVYVNEGVSTHFVSHEPIRYVDISTNDVVGDMPVENILRVKPKDAGARLGIVTIVGEKFMVQYQLAYATSSRADSEVRIDPTLVDEYLNPQVSMSSQDMRKFALLAFERKPAVNAVAVKKDKMTATLNNIYSIGDYFFVDISLFNNTNIKYDIDQIRFKIEDKKVVKATNFQQVELKPEHQLLLTDSFKKKYRNVFVFKKFTFPDEKVFNIEIAEKQISGRTISLKIAYSDVLNADTL